MAVEAHVNPPWKYKWLVMGLAMFGFAGWCYYDATVAYPAHNERVEKFEEFTQLGKLEEWESFAKEQGWPTDNPGKPHTDMSIFTQYIMMGITIPLGVWILVMVGWHHGRTLVADEVGLTGASGGRVPYEAITHIDKKRWDAKGIAIVHYDDSGKQGTVKIDDWVFKDGDLVLKEVESHTGLGEPAAV